MTLTINVFEGERKPPDIPPSRTIDLTEPSTLNRYIRHKKEQQRRLKEYENWKRKEGR